MFNTTPENRQTLNNGCLPQKRTKGVWVVIITPYYVTYNGSWMRVCKLIYHTKPHQMANTLKKKEGGFFEPKILIVLLMTTTFALVLSRILNYLNQ